MSSDVSIEPGARLKKLNQKASDFICDNKIPVMRYLRSTMEMEKMVSSDPRFVKYPLIIINI